MDFKESNYYLKKEAGYLKEYIKPLIKDKTFAYKTK